jgi:hypothetical protein
MSVLVMAAAPHVHHQYGHLSIRWETHRKRITAVSPTSTNRNTTTVRMTMHDKIQF